ncbi:MAG: hypothetical protein IPM54_02670 [Polyangiaceae bacterium]|nr:hypothetical protein [Polyangiaceae bacterium]
MLFRVQNLGPLREAEVDLSKDIIVLAGPNNSGKTYLAWSVYGLHRMRPQPQVDLTRWVKQLIESPDHSIDIAEFFAAENDKIIASITKQYQGKLHLCFAADESRFAGASIGIYGVTSEEILRIAATGMLADGRSLTLDVHDRRLYWVLEPSYREIDAKAILQKGFRTPEAQAVTTTMVAAMSVKERAIAAKQNFIHLAGPRP